MTKTPFADFVGLYHLPPDEIISEDDIPTMEEQFFIDAERLNLLFERYGYGTRIRVTEMPADDFNRDFLSRVAPATPKAKTMRDKLRIVPTVCIWCGGNHSDQECSKP